MTNDEPIGPSKPGLGRVLMWIALAFGLIVIGAGMWLRSSAGQEWLRGVAHSVSH